MSFTNKCPTCGKELTGVIMMADVDDWECSECTSDQGSILHCEKGSKICFDQLKAGHDYEREEAMSILKKGGIYTVKQIIIYGFHSSVELEEVPGHSFNSVLFSRAG